MRSAPRRSSESRRRWFQGVERTEVIAARWHEHKRSGNTDLGPTSLRLPERLYTLSSLDPCDDRAHTCYVLWQPDLPGHVRPDIAPGNSAPAWPTPACIAALPRRLCESRV